MPRYRFSWDNIDVAVRDALCPGEADPGTTARELRRRFGVRPQERLVADCWDVLRDRWLARDDAVRADVVADLRAAGLGDTALPIGGAAQDVAYLHSCRNQKTLRRVVLAAFIRSGESPHPLTKAEVEGPTWDEFEAALAGVLPALSADQCLVLSVRGTGVEDVPGPPGSSYYVQFVVVQGGLRAEAVSNSFLAGDERLSSEAQIRLVGLGWQPPTHLPGDEEEDPTGSPNYFHDHHDPVLFAEVAATAVTTLREVYGAADPAVLSYLAFDQDGTEFELPALRVGHQQLPSNIVTIEAEHLLPVPETPEEIRALVEQAILPVLTGNEVLYDSDGDIPIRFGSTQVFVRSSDDAPVVRVFAILITDLSLSAALSDAINELNQRYLFGKFFWDGRSVVMSIDVPCHPFVASHLLHAVGTVGQVGDELDEELQEQFGGRTFHGVRSPRPDEGLSGGYL